MMNPLWMLVHPHFLHVIGPFVTKWAAIEYRDQFHDIDWLAKEVTQPGTENFV